MPPKHSNLHGRPQANNHGRNVTVNGIAHGHNGHGSTLADVSPMLDLISWWDLEEGSGQVRVDQQSNNDMSESFTVNSTTGKVGTCADFPGGAILIKTSPVVHDADTSFTVGGWFWVDVLNQSQGGFTHYNNPGQQGWTLFPIGEEPSIPSGQRNRFRFGVSSNGSDDFSKSAESMSTINTGQWYFVIGWYDEDADTVNIQVDDGAVDSGAGPTSLHESTYQLEFGGLSPFSILDGRLDSMFYYNRLLTSDERSWLYNGGRGRSFSELS